MNPPAESNQLLWLKDIEYNTHYKTCENLAKELKQLHFLRYFYVTCYNSSIAQPVVIKVVPDQLFTFEIVKYIAK